MTKTFQKSEVLEIFKNCNIKEYNFNQFNNNLFWVNVSDITWKELRRLGNNILTIHPWDNDSLKITIENVIDE